MKLLVSAGEVSSDQHASALLDALKLRVPELETFGIAGDRCAARGMRLVAHQKDLAVVGLVEAIGKLRFAARLVKRLAREAVAARADAAVLVDSPDFNIPLARRLAGAGVPVVFFVSPQVWAWRASRAEEIARLGRAILVLFAFEKRWYDARGIGRNVVWVGHPLVDAAARELGTDLAGPGNPRPRPAGPEQGPPPPRRVALMPGSRRGEIRRNLPVMRDAIERLRASRPGLEVAIVRADSVPEGFLREVGGPALDAWTFVSGPHLGLLAASDALLVASGTATVEGLLARVPMVVVYRVNALTFFLARRLVKVAHVAMANIVSDDGSGTRAVPELIQKDATPSRIAAELAAYLDDPARARAARERLARGAADLGPPGAAARAADALLAALRGAAA